MANLALFCLLLLLVSWAPRGREGHEFVTRQILGMTIGCLWLAWNFPNPWLGLLLSISALGVWWAPQPIDTHRLILLPGLPWVLVYWLGAIYAQESWIVPVLGICVAIGAIQGLWMLYSVFIGGRYYKHPFGFFEVYENHHSGLTAGQTNSSMMDQVAGVTTAAAIGLVWCCSWWWLAGAVLCAIPILVNQIHKLSCQDYNPTQGVLSIGAICLALLMLLHSFWWFTGIGVAGVVLSWHQWHRTVMWSYRDQIWRYVLKYWWVIPWPGKLIGCGTGSWIPLYQRSGPTRHIALATHPHNEYLHILFEHGAIGLLAILGYVGTALWQSSHGTPELQAVAITGLTLCTVAAVSFPWTLFHEVAFIQDQQAGQQGVTVNGHGTPTLNALTLAIAILVEVV